MCKSCSPSWRGCFFCICRHILICSYPNLEAVLEIKSLRNVFYTLDLWILEAVKSPQQHHLSLLTLIYGLEVTDTVHFSIWHKVCSPSQTTGRIASGSKCSLFPAESLGYDCYLSYFIHDFRIIQKS